MTAFSEVQLPLSSVLGSSPVGVFCSFVPNPLRRASSEYVPPRFQDPWRSPQLEYIDDVGRVYGDVRGNGMVGPQVYPRVTRPYGQDRLDHARAEVLEHQEDHREHPVGNRIVSRPGLEEVYGGVGDTPQDDRRRDGAGELEEAGQEDGVDEDHDRKPCAKEVQEKG